MSPRLKKNLPKVCLAVLWAALILLAFHYRKEISLNLIVSDSPSNKMLAALFLLGLFALKSVSFFIYIGLLYMAAGLLFDYPAAVLVCMAGTVLAQSIPYGLGRLLKKGQTDSWMTKYPKLESFTQKLQEHGFVTVFLMRTIARLPSDAVSMFCGIQKMPYGIYLGAGFLASLPHILIFPALASSIQNPDSVPFLLSVGAEILWTGVCLGLYFWNRKKQEKRNGKQS